MRYPSNGLSTEHQFPFILSVYPQSPSRVGPEINYWITLCSLGVYFRNAVSAILTSSLQPSTQVAKFGGNAWNSRCTLKAFFSIGGRGKEVQIPGSLWAGNKQGSPAHTIKLPPSPLALSPERKRKTVLIDKQQSISCIRPIWNIHCNKEAKEWHRYNWFWFSKNAIPSVANSGEAAMLVGSSGAAID